MRPHDRLPLIPAASREHRRGCPRIDGDQTDQLRVDWISYFVVQYIRAAPALRDHGSAMSLTRNYGSAEPAAL